MRLKSFFILLFCLFLTASNGAFAATFLASIEEHTGTVEVLRSGETAWLPILDGGGLSAGDRVRTKEQSTAEIVRQDGTTLELLPLAEVTVVDENGFFVQLGQVWSHFVKAVKGEFYLKTPTATALIRGTILSVSYDGQDSRVVVREGLVSVRDIGTGIADVSGGQAISVRLGRLSHLERAGVQELNEGRRFFERQQRREGFDKDRRSPIEGPKERLMERFDQRRIMGEPMMDRRDQLKDAIRERRGGMDSPENRLPPGNRMPPNGRP